MPASFFTFWNSYEKKVNFILKNAIVINNPFNLTIIKKPN